MKKYLGIAILLALVLGGCNVVGSVINPVIGTWSNNTLGIITSDVFNADGTTNQTITVLGVGVTKSGSWTSNGTTFTRTWSDTSTDTYFYSFTSDNKKMTISLTQGGLASTFDRQ